MVNTLYHIHVICVILIAVLCSNPFALCLMTFMLLWGSKALSRTILACFWLHIVVCVSCSVCTWIQMPFPSLVWYLIFFRSILLFFLLYWPKKRKGGFFFSHFQPKCFKTPGQIIADSCGLACLRFYHWRKKIYTSMKKDIHLPLLSTCRRQG